MKQILMLLVLLANLAVAHEQSPAIIMLEKSYSQGILEGKLKLGNIRNDAEYFRLFVVDKDGNDVPFASTKKVIHLPEGRENISFFVRDEDVEKIDYVCTKSIFVKKESGTYPTSSKICSRVSR